MVWGFKRYSLRYAEIYALFYGSYAGFCTIYVVTFRVFLKFLSCQITFSCKLLYGSPDELCSASKFGQPGGSIRQIDILADELNDTTPDSRTSLWVSYFSFSASSLRCDWTCRNAAFVDIVSCASTWNESLEFPYIWTKWGFWLVQSDRWGSSWSRWGWIREVNGPAQSKLPDS